MEGAERVSRRIPGKEFFLAKENNEKVRIIVRPELTILQNGDYLALPYLGQNVEDRLNELSRENSNFEIARVLSTGNIQVTTAAINYLEWRYGIHNKNNSPQHKYDSEVYRIALEIKERKLLGELPEKERITFFLSHMIAYRTLPAEIQRVLGLASLKEAKELDQTSIVAAKKLLENPTVASQGLR